MERTTMNRRRLMGGAAAGVAAVAGLGGFAFAQDAPPEGSPAASPGASPAASPAASPVGSPVAEPSPEAPAAATEVKVSMLDFKFEPREMSIAADTDVTVTATNNGVAIHNWHVEDPLIGTPDVTPGGVGSVVVNLPAGEYKVICTIPGHVDLGMVGVLTVA